MKRNSILCCFFTEGASETLPAGPFAVETFGRVKEPPGTEESGAGMAPPASASAGAGADNGGRYVE